MKLKIPKINMYSLLLISIFFDAYALIYVDTYPVTMFTIVSILFLIHNIVNNNCKCLKITRQSAIMLVFIIYLFINYIYFDLENTSSFVLTLFFLILSLFSYRDETKENFEGYCKLFQKLMTYMSIYGIYQLIGRLLHLPFTDLIIEGHMVTGYNWTNSISVFGHLLYRSNAMFREPSYFSQMLAISLLLYVPIFLSKNERTRGNIVSFILQMIALITTFSGTGILVFIIGMIIFSITIMKKRFFWNRIVPLVIICVIVGIILIFFTNLGNYFLSRIQELFVYNRDASSGFVRFRAWVEVVKEAWTYNFLLGSGIGTGSIYVSKYIVQYFGMTLSGFARVATELGLIGIIIWCNYILSFLNKNEVNVSIRYVLLCCSLIPLIFMQEAFSSNIFWMFIILINCKFTKQVKRRTKQYV